MVAVDDDPAAGVDAYAGLFEAETFGVGRAAGGDQNGVASRTVPVESVTLSRPSRTTTATMMGSRAA